MLRSVYAICATIFVFVSAYGQPIATSAPSDSLYFDFWEGHWCVLKSNGEADTSRYFKIIRSVHSSAFEEHWQMQNGIKAAAIRAWDKTAHTWGYVWISSTGLYQIWDTRKHGDDWLIYRYFVLNGRRYLSRHSLLRQSDGTVLWKAERSYDEKTWELNFQERLQKMKE